MGQIVEEFEARRSIDQSHHTSFFTIQHPHALLIDDDRLFLAITSSHLAQSGDEVTTATSWREAQTLLEHNEYDYILLDVFLGTDNGIELIAEVTRLAPRSPVVLVSSSEDFNVAMEAMRHGAFDFLRKPVDVSLLHAARERALHIRQLRRKNVKLTEELAAQVVRREVLLDYTRALYGMHAIAPLIETALEHTRAGLKVEVCAVYLRSAGQEQLLRKAAGPASRSFAALDGIAMRSIAERRTLVLNHAQEWRDTGLAPPAGIPDFEGIAAMATPIGCTEQGLGALVVAGPRDRYEFDPEAARLFSEMSLALCVAYSNAVATQSLVEAERRLKVANEQLEHRVRERTQALETTLEELRYSNKALQAAQDKLLRVARAETRVSMAGQLAHEINNPLSVVLANLAHMQRRFQKMTPYLAKIPGVDIEESAQLYSESLENGKRIAAVVRDIADLRTSVAHKATLELGPFLNTCVGRPLLSGEQAAELPAVLADERLLSRVVSHLLENGYAAGERTTPEEVHFDAVAVHPDTVDFVISVPWLHDAGEMHEANFHFAAAGLLMEMQDGKLVRSPAADDRVLYTVTLPRANTDTAALGTNEPRWVTTEFAPLPALSAAAA